MRHSKSTLMLMELSISILFFALCAAVCLQLFAKAGNISEDSLNFSSAVAAVEMAAEQWMAGEKPESEVTYYDKNWKQVDKKSEAAFLVKVNEYDEAPGDRLMNCVIEAKAGENVIYSLILVRMDKNR